MKFVRKISRYGSKILYKSYVPPSICETRGNENESEETQKGDVWDHPQIVGKFKGGGGMLGP